MTTQSENVLELNLIAHFLSDINHEIALVDTQLTKTLGLRNRAVETDVCVGIMGLNVEKLDKKVYISGLLYYICSNRT